MGVGRCRVRCRLVLARRAAALSRERCVALGLDPGRGVLSTCSSIGSYREWYSRKPERARCAGRVLVVRGREASAAPRSTRAEIARAAFAPTTRQTVTAGRSASLARRTVHLVLLLSLCPRSSAARGLPSRQQHAASCTSRQPDSQPAPSRPIPSSSLLHTVTAPARLQRQPATTCGLGGLTQQNNPLVSPRTCGS